MGHSIFGRQTRGHLNNGLHLVALSRSVFCPTLEKIQSCMDDFGLFINDPSLNRAALGLARQPYFSLALGTTSENRVLVLK